MVASTFSLRQLPKSKEELAFGNSLVVQYHPIACEMSFDEGVDKAKNIAKKLKGNVMNLWGAYYMIWIFTLLPLNLPSIGVRIFAQKVTMSYSNMPGPSKGFNFNGSNCNSLSVFLPAFDEQLCGITAWSLGNVLKVGLISDY